MYVFMHVLQQFFARRSVHPASIHITTDPVGRPSGQAFVTFNNDGEASEALKLDHEKIGECPSVRIAFSIAYVRIGLRMVLVLAGERWIDIFPARKDEMYAAMPSLGGSSGGNSDGRQVVKLRGIPFECPRSELCAFLKDAHPKESNIYFVSSRSGNRIRIRVIERLEREEFRWYDLVGWMCGMDASVAPNGWEGQWGGIRGA